MPRLIPHRNTLCIVTPEGEIWQVFDANAGDYVAGGLPRNDAEVVARIFVANNGGLIRIYRFGIRENRSITAWGILEQLRRATVGDDRAA